jgi:HemY protein
MKKGLYLAAALLIGAILASILMRDTGYVALRFAGYLVEMSAVTFALVVIGAYALIRLLVRTLNARRLWKEQQRARRWERARRSMAQGTLELAEGAWETAENTLTRYARDAETPAAHFLIAARAADLQGAEQRRDEWLNKAMEFAPTQRAPALIMQAEAHLKHKRFAAAQITLEQLEASGEMNARGLLLLARVYRQTGAWQQLQALEPKLRKARGIPASLADETLEQIHLDRLKSAETSVDFGALSAVWKDLPRSIAQRSEVIATYARACIACGRPEAAEKELRDAISRHWDESLVLLYGDLEVEDALGTLERAERWLPEHREDAALLLTCARLCARAELYGKARSYLETSVAIKPRIEAYQLLADFMEQIGDRERALQALHEALALAVGTKTRLPKIRSRRWLERRHNDRRRG